MVSANISATDWGRNDIDENGGGDDVTRYSNNFMIRVLPTDDAPVILSVNEVPPTDHEVSFTGDYAASEDTYFNLTVDAFDVDGDPMQFSSDEKLENMFLNEDTGVLTFLPDNGDVGTHVFKVTVIEENSSVMPLKSDSVNITLEVRNTNDAPKIKSLDMVGGNSIKYDGKLVQLRVNERSWLNWTIKYADDDSDVCTFSSNFSNPRFNIDATTGLCTFGPIQEDVGTHYIELYADDGNYGVATAYVRLVVSNVNDRPVAEDITYKSQKNNLTVVLRRGRGQAQLSLGLRRREDRQRPFAPP